MPESLVARPTRRRPWARAVGGVGRRENMWGFFYFNDNWAISACDVDRKGRADALDVHFVSVLDVKLEQFCF